MPKPKEIAIYQGDIEDLLKNSVVQDTLRDKACTYAFDHSIAWFEPEEQRLCLTVIVQAFGDGWQPTPGKNINQKDIQGAVNRGLAARKKLIQEATAWREHLRLPGYDGARYTQADDFLIEPDRFKTIERELLRPARITDLAGIKGFVAEANERAETLTHVSRSIIETIVPSATNQDSPRYLKLIADNPSKKAMLIRGFLASTLLGMTHARGFYTPMYISNRALVELEELTWTELPTPDERNEFCNALCQQLELPEEYVGSAQVMLSGYLEDIYRRGQRLRLVQDSDFERGDQTSIRYWETLRFAFENLPTTDSQLSSRIVMNPEEIPAAEAAGLPHLWMHPTPIGTWRIPSEADLYEASLLAKTAKSSTRKIAESRILRLAHLAWNAYHRTKEKGPEIAAKLQQKLEAFGDPTTFPQIPNTEIPKGYKRKIRRYHELEKKLKPYQKRNRRINGALDTGNPEAITARYIMERQQELQARAEYLENQLTNIQRLYEAPILADFNYGVRVQFPRDWEGLDRAKKEHGDEITQTRKNPADYPPALQTLLTQPPELVHFLRVLARTRTHPRDNNILLLLTSATQGKLNDARLRWEYQSDLRYRLQQIQRFKRCHQQHSATLTALKCIKDYLKDPTEATLTAVKKTLPDYPADERTELRLMLMDTQHPHPLPAESLHANYNEIANFLGHFRGNRLKVDFIIPPLSEIPAVIAHLQAQVLDVVVRSGYPRQSDTEMIRFLHLVLAKSLTEVEGLSANRYLRVLLERKETLRSLLIIDSLDINIRKAEKKIKTARMWAPEIRKQRNYQKIKDQYDTLLARVSDPEEALLATMQSLGLAINFETDQT